MFSKLFPVINIHMRNRTSLDQPKTPENSKPPRLPEAKAILCVSVPLCDNICGDITRDFHLGTFHETSLPANLLDNVREA